MRSNKYRNLSLRITSLVVLARFKRWSSSTLRRWWSACISSLSLLDAASSIAMATFSSFICSRSAVHKSDIVLREQHIQLIGSVLKMTVPNISHWSTQKSQLLSFLESTVFWDCEPFPSTLQNRIRNMIKKPEASPWNGCRYRCYEPLGCILHLQAEFAHGRGDHKAPCTAALALSSSYILIAIKDIFILHLEKNFPYNSKK